MDIKELAKKLCDESGCHHKCKDIDECVVMEEAEEVIANSATATDKSNNELVPKGNELPFVLTNEDKVSVKEKQIEEMAKDICKLGISCEECTMLARKTNQTREQYCKAFEYAKRAYNAGYRKQSEGCDFCKAGNEKCGTCVKFFDYYEDGGSDRCSSEYGNEKCAYYKPVHHCSNCGAKMKGGE